MSLHISNHLSRTESLSKWLISVLDRKHSAVIAASASAFSAVFIPNEQSPSAELACARLSGKKI